MHSGSSLSTFLAILALTSCGTKGSGDPSTPEQAPQEKKEEKKEETKTIRVRVSPLSRGDIASVIETTASVEAESIVDVYPKVGGIIAKIFVEEGDWVEPGRTLAKIDDKEARLRADQAEVAFREAQLQEKQFALALEEAQQREKQAKNNAEQAQRDYERNRNLDAAREQNQASLISQKDLEASKLAWDKAEGEYQVARFGAKKSSVEVDSAKIAAEKARIAWELAKVALEDTEIKARTRGVVSHRGIRGGETVTLSTRAFTVVDLERLQTNFYRPQKELRFLAPDIPIEAVCEAFPDRVFRGHVLRVNPVVDPTSGTFKVTARIENSERLLRSGMLIRMRITTAKHPEAYLIPKKAVYYEGDQPVIFAMREGVAVRIPLNAGFSDPERIEVLNVSEEGVRPEDKIIVVGSAELRHGAKVEVVDS